jgi:hypothetical protein
MRVIAAAIGFSVLCSCAPKPAPAPHDLLNGTWQSNIMTVTIDFNHGTFAGVAMGQPFSLRMKLISEQGNVVTFRTGKVSTEIAQIQDDGSVMLTKEVTKDDPDGGIPLVLKRAPSHQQG